MKTEQEIKENLEYVRGYKDALSNYKNNMELSIDEDIAEFTGQVKAFEWVLENSNPNCEVKNDNK